MTDKNTSGAFGACKCRAAEELATLREEVQIKDEEIGVLRKRLHHCEQTTKKWTMRCR